MDGSHSPFFMENPDSKGLVMFIHGFLGSPRQFADLAQRVYDCGYSAASLLLPGHNCSVREFATVTMEDWQNHLGGEIERLSLNHSKIILVGHSMGGLLALNASIKFSNCVKSVFIIASPFRLAVFSAKSNKARLKLIFSGKSTPVKASYLSGVSIGLSQSLLWHIIKPFFQLKKLMRITEKNLQNVRAPVSAVYSLSDELVSIKSLKILKSGLVGERFEQVVLSDSMHAVFTEEERETIMQALDNALKGMEYPNN